MHWLSSAWRLTLGGAALALAVPLLTSAVSPDALKLREVDGGRNYYSRFSGSIPSDPDYFPIGVWYESVLSPTDVGLDKDAGINLYLVLTSSSDLSLVQRSGMQAILQSELADPEWRDAKGFADKTALAGWVLFDEVDMQQGPDRGYVTLANILAKLPKDGRLRYNNYGKGVMFWETTDQATGFVKDFQDVVSTDNYWFTDPNLSGGSEGGRLLNGGRPLTPTETRRAANYGYTIDRMRLLAKGRKPVWNFVEVGWPFNLTQDQGGRAIEPSELKAAVWQGIIAGARGVVYFNHSFGGPNQSQHCLREPAYAAVRAAVKSTNRLIMQLAPVLNAPFADGFASVTPTVRAMTKFHDGKYYVFAGSKENVGSNATFSLLGVENGTAIVVDENRTLPIVNRQFSDSFNDGNAIHIYQIEPQ